LEKKLFSGCHGNGHGQVNPSKLGKGNKQIRERGCIIRSLGRKTNKIFSISSHFSLWEAASQTKTLLLAQTQAFWPSQNFGLAMPLLSNRMLQQLLKL